MTKDMKENGYDTSKYPPVDVANAEGKLIIIDGHHRARAALDAEIKEIPARVMDASKEQASKLLEQAADAKLR